MADYNQQGGTRLSPIMALRLAAPQTWIASLIPAALGRYWPFAPWEVLTCPCCCALWVFVY